MDVSYSVDIHNAHFDADTTRLEDETPSGRSKPRQLNTARLKPYRQVTRAAILSILETGHVSLELLKRRDGQERVAEVFVVSPDGSEVCIEQWQAGSPALCENSEQTWRTFPYPTLPEKYWKKYAHAYRFVDLVKSKTAKVTMYSDHAKGVLMENSPPSFEVTFYHAGPKIVLTGKEVYIKEDSGASLIFTTDTLHNLVNDYTMGLVKHASQMREQCLRLEASVATVEATNQTGEPLFPITVGARPFTSFCSSTSSTSECLDPLSASCSSPHLYRGLSASPSDPQSLSPPASGSPVPILDFRSAVETPRKSAVPTPEPSPVKERLHCSLSSAVQTESPYRHVSTLESRKMRRQLSSASTESSGIEEATNLSATHSNLLSSPYPRKPTDVGMQSAANVTSPEFMGSQRSGPSAYSDQATANVPTPVTNFKGLQSPSLSASPSRHANESVTAPFSSINQDDFRFVWEPASKPPVSGQNQSDPVGHISPRKEPVVPATTKRVQHVPLDLQGSNSPFTSAIKTGSVAMRTVPHFGPAASHKLCGADFDGHTGYVPRSATNGSRELNRVATGMCGSEFGAMSSAHGHEGDVSGTSAAALSDDSAALINGGGAGSSSAASGVTECEGSSSIVRQTFVAYTGWASQLASGAVWIRYNDGTQLGIHCAQAEIIYVDQDGTTRRYVQTNGIPEVVRQKLEKLPMVLDCLMTRPAAQPYGIVSSCRNAFMHPPQAALSKNACSRCRPKSAMYSTDRLSAASICYRL